jgi:hypothetical protein
MVDQEYEILPHQLLQDLRYDVEALKKKLSSPDAKANELILEMESMKDSSHELTDLFRKALGEMQGDNDAAKSLTLIKEKMDTVISQNETIAKGMIAISDKLENFMSQRPKTPVHRPMGQHNMGPPPSPGRMAPHPAAPTGGMDFPPPPPSMNQRKGLFK